MKIYKSLDEILEIHMGDTMGRDRIPIDELRGRNGDNYTISWTTPDGTAAELGFAKYYNSANNQKFYGFVKDKKDISIWYDKERCDMKDLITLVAHEKGHTIEPFYEDQSKEELKAQKYADIAVEAYTTALKLLNKK